MPRAGQSPGSEEARLLRAGALAGPRFPIRTRRGGWGHRAPSRTKPGASLARQVVHLGAGAASFCLVGSLSVAMRAPRAGPQGGPGAGVLGSQPTGAEPGSVICAWQVGDGSLGQRGGLNRAPAWAPVSAHACPAGLPLPGEGLCAAGTPGGWGRPRGGRFWGCPLVGTRKGAVLASLPAPTPLRDSRPLCPRGPHPGLGTKIHWTFLPAPPDWLAAAALQRKDVGSERLGVWRRAPAAHGGRGLAPPRALPATSSPILPPQAQTP